MTQDQGRRQHPRYPVNLTVDFTTREAFVGNHVSNLSRGGLFIATDSPLPVHSELDLELTLPQRDERIRARGRVIWNYDIRRGTSRVVPGMGIKFLDMSTADNRRLTDYLATLAVASANAPSAS